MSDFNFSFDDCEELPETKPLINLLASGNVICDESLSTTVDNHHKNDSEINVSNKDANKEVVDEDPHRESPTTGDSFTFKCVFCEQVLTGHDEPKLLECLHNVCGKCLLNNSNENRDNNANSESDKGKFECPHCNIVCEPSKIIDNQFLLELTSNEENTAKIAELKCSSCDDASIATSWCVECAEYICDSCVQAHQRLKITKDHTIKSKEEALNDNQSTTSTSSPNLYCNLHVHEKLSLFCETCDKLTCRDCQLIEHREHKYKFTDEIAWEARKFIADMLKDVGYKRSLLFSAMKVIDERQNLITEKKQSLVKEITQLVVKLTNTINVRGKQLVAKLTEVCDSKQNTLQEKKQALEQLSRITDHCIDFTKHALDNGSDMALLYSKKHVTNHLKRIKCRRADIPNPEIPVRIHLALDKFPELVKGLSSVMSQIGQIVVDGRPYPSTSQSSSVPLSSNSPQNSSPSPNNNNNRSPQEQAPINQVIQQQQQQTFNTSTPSNYNQSSSRLPPPYGNGWNPNMYSGNMTNRHSQNLTQMQPQNPYSQHLQSVNRMNMQQRPMQMQRPLMLRMQANNMNQVSSSTHPQNMQNATMQERNNLRHLLQPAANSNPVYIQTGPSQYQAVQPHLAEQYQNRFSRTQQPNFPAPQQQQQQQQYQQQNQIRMMHSMRPMQQQHQQMPPQQRPYLQGGSNSSSGSGGGPHGWHIPQQQQSGAIQRNSFNNAPINDHFKITLKQQQQQQQQQMQFNQDNRNLAGTTTTVVTSTIPKTPSPNHVMQSGNNSRSDTERSLDKYCQDSVKDLMATIAKLDSNGVQVVAESGRNKVGQSGSPHVDSSTGDAGPVGKMKNDSLLDCGKDDPNEDWCAVCMDGGELVCCDKCPKVFHQYCHIPNLSVEENDTWQCLLCTNFADFPEHYLSERKDGELCLKDKKIAERILLELYCQYDPSLPFREVIGPENEAYHTIIKNPIALDTIRQKLNWKSPDHYVSMVQMIKDVRQMFKNAYLFNSEDSQVYADAKALEKFFDEQLEKFLPEYAYERFDDDDNANEVPPFKRFRRD